MTIYSFQLTLTQIAGYEHNNNNFISCQLVIFHWLQAVFVAQRGINAATAVTVGCCPVLHDDLQLPIDPSPDCGI